MDRSKFGADITSTVFEQGYLEAVNKRLDECMAEQARWANRAGFGNRIHDDNEFDFHTRRRVEIANRKLLGYKRLKEKLYHGRVDFRWQLDSDHQLVYIGEVRLDANDGDILIHDWRSPICALYSQYTEPGPAEFMHDRIQRGTLLLRRTYEVANGKVNILSSTDAVTLSKNNVRSRSSSNDVSIEMPAREVSTLQVANAPVNEGQLVADAVNSSSNHLDSPSPADATFNTVDPMLADLLSKNTTGSMQQVVRSIQAEQDVVIRATAPIVAVQGPAGSGKSVIALHRASYLLYHMREAANDPDDLWGRFSASKVMVFSPNATFSSYIASVMPALMEDKLQNTVLTEMLPTAFAKTLRKPEAYKIERTVDQYEAAQKGALKKVDDLRLKAMAFKSSLEIYEEMVAFFKSVELFLLQTISKDLIHVIEGTERQVRASARLKQQVLVDKQTLVSAFNFDKEAPLIARIDAVLAVETDKINELRKQNDFFAAVTKDVSIAKLRELFTPVRDTLISVRNIQSLRWYSHFLQYLESGVLGDLLSGDAPRQENQLVSGVKKLMSRRHAVRGSGRSLWIEATMKSLRKRQIWSEDVLPIVFLHGFVAGFPAMNGVIHAVVDEAQDYSILHYQYLRRLLPDRCSISIVGDPNQSIHPHVQTTNFESLKKVFPECAVMPPLKFCYRSSKEITDFASSLLADGSPIASVRATGVRPELVRVGTGGTANVVGDLVRKLNDEGFASVGVVCRSTAEAVAMHSQLAGDVAINILDEKTTEFEVGNYVAPLVYAKGLEFDAVIIPDAGSLGYRSEMDRRPFYTACTRALHRLYLCYEKRRSPLLPPEASGLFTTRA